MAPNPTGISVTPSEIDGSSSSHVRVLTLYKGSGHELGSNVTRRPSAPQKGFISLFISARSGEKRLSGHLGRSRPMLL
ncbi:hypothetical protein Taro_016222 [Colocasia esculenta]|uniref:Uncharacterized protein n=1 Tax=Colocasia esculenta TaxID=4460 RepID=A0A843USB4_COLES|nr:hypothetical protein [Colocasia esculenta]